MMLTPPTIAMLQTPRRNFSTARSSATSDEEHAVSTVMLGPFKPYK